MDLQSVNNNYSGIKKIPFYSNHDQVTSWKVRNTLKNNHTIPLNVHSRASIVSPI